MSSPPVHTQRPPEKLQRPPIENFLATVLCSSVETVEFFMNTHLHYIVTNPSRISKILMLLAPGKISADACSSLENLQIACCINYRNLPGHFCQKKSNFVTITLTWGIFLGCRNGKAFVNYHMRCIVSKLKIICKMSTLPLLEKFLQTPMLPTQPKLLPPHTSQIVWANRAGWKGRGSGAIFTLGPLRWISWRHRL